MQGFDLLSFRNRSKPSATSSKMAYVSTSAPLQLANATNSCLQQSSPYSVQHLSATHKDPNILCSNDLFLSHRARAQSMSSRYIQHKNYDEVRVTHVFGMDIIAAENFRHKEQQPDIGFSDYVAMVKKSLQESSRLPEFNELLSLEDRLTRGAQLTEEFFSPIKYYFSTPCSPEEEEIVDFLWSTRRPSTEVVIKNDEANVELQRHELRSLSSRSWLTDEVINLFMHLLNKRSTGNPKGPKVYCFSTFFWSKLSEGGRYQYSNVARWTKRKKIDIFNFDSVLFPVHVGENHWTLGAVDLHQHTVSVYDSLGGGNGLFCELVVRWIADEWQDKKGTPYSDGGRSWTVVSGSNRKGADGKKEAGVVGGVPLQNNSYDCGVFTCLFAERLAAGGTFIFRQTDMDVARRKITVCLSKGVVL
eukprot:GDKJ01052343.1.p1 GENE.GDKJ01052343.1~~GDKJ01052343.1.p1  ORF type:complete len:417 (+),score=63.07 GDKJ01052343.1:15-1265(+)